MTEDQRFTRRAFLKRFGLGAAAGGTVAAVTYEEPKQQPNNQKPADSEKLRLGRMAGGALLGGFLTEFAFRARTQSAPPPYSQDKEERIRDEHEAGRNCEYWQKRSVDGDEKNKGL